MNYGMIKNCDIANGEGVRISLFVSGCRNCCKGCFNPDTWDFNYGKPFTEETESEIIELLKPDYIAGLTVLGGEPFEPENQRELVRFLTKVKAACPDKTIWAYSGYYYHEIIDKGKHPNCEVTDELLKYIDVLVDGKFIEELKDLSLPFRGSLNQRVLRLRNGAVNLIECNGGFTWGKLPTKSTRKRGTKGTSNEEQSETA